MLSYFGKLTFLFMKKTTSTHKKNRTIIAHFNRDLPFDQHLQFHLSHQEVQASPERETKWLIILVWKEMQIAPKLFFLLLLTCSPTGPGGPGNPLDPSSPFCPNRPCWPLGPGSPSAPWRGNMQSQTTAYANRLHSKPQQALRQPAMLTAGPGAPTGPWGPVGPGGPCREEGKCQQKHLNWWKKLFSRVCFCCVLFLFSTAAYVLSFVAFASLLAGLSDLSLRGRNTITAWKIQVSGRGR